MTREAPPRLKDDPAIGPLLAAVDAGAELAPDRLARNAVRVRAAIADRDRRKAFPLWRVAVPIALALAAIVVARALLRDDDTGAPAARLDAAPPAPDATPIAVVDPVPDPVPVPVPVPVPDPDPAPRPHRDRPTPPPPPPAPDAAPAPAQSDLPEQIQLYEDARAAGKRGELALGIDKLDELLRRFPSTPLRADAELTRAEFLTRADRTGDAAAALTALVADGAHAGRRGELLRALGDVRRKQGDCAAATDAYTRARAEKLSAREAAKVARGLERCESLKATTGSGDPPP
jgi:hypothetical protein